MELLIGFVAAFLVTWLFGKKLVPMLRALKAGQSIKEIGPSWHMSKQGTPTMGGLMFIVGIGAAVVLGGWRQMMSGVYTHLVVFVFALAFGIIGMLDDYRKIKKSNNTGLSAGEKFVLQLAAALLFTILLRYKGFLTPNLYIPFVDTELILPWPIYMAFAAFAMVGTVNAVNITDGVDGLASGVTIPVALFYAAVAAWYGYMELGVLAAAVAGGLVAFLIYNFHPAKVFMGDTGSLFLGGMVCGLGFALNIPLIIPVVGLIYVAEVLSDIIQVTYFKLSGGKRIFKMAPLHHHFEMCGWSEIKLFFVFSMITAVLCMASFWGVMDRIPV